MVIGVEILDLAGELGLELRSVKVGDGSGSALSGYGVEPVVSTSLPIGVMAPSPVTTTLLSSIGKMNFVRGCYVEESF